MYFLPFPVVVVLLRTNSHFHHHILTTPFRTSTSRYTYTLPFCLIFLGLISFSFKVSVTTVFENLLCSTSYNQHFFEVEVFLSAFASDPNFLNVFKGRVTPFFLFLPFKATYVVPSYIIIFR